MAQMLRTGAWVARQGRGDRLAITHEEALEGLLRAAQDLNIPEGKTVPQKRLIEHAAGRFISVRAVTLRDAIRRFSDEERKAVHLPPKQKRDWG